MIRSQVVSVILSLFILCGGSGCKQKLSEQSATTFTEADSLTEIYLNYQDSILLAWNLMINDDNQKIKDMHTLLQELEAAGPLDSDQITVLEQRVMQLKDKRYTPKSLENSDAIDEYDFASNSLVSELITLAESHPAYLNNTSLQNLVEQIRTAEQRIENYRIDYDAIVTSYNNFLTEHRGDLSEGDIPGKLEKKPIFQMALE